MGRRNGKNIALGVRPLQPIAHAVISSSPSAEAVDMNEQIGGVLVDTESRGLFKFARAIAAAEQADAEGAAARGGEHIPDANRRRRTAVSIGALSFSAAARRDRAQVSRREPCRASRWACLSMSMPSAFRLISAVSIRPLVAIAQRILAAVRKSSSSRAPRQRPDLPAELR